MQLSLLKHTRLFFALDIQKLPPQTPISKQFSDGCIVGPDFN